MAASDKLDLAIEDALGIVTKTDNKSTPDLQASFLNQLDSLNQRTLQVLDLTGFLQAVCRWSFNTKKNPDEISLDHKLQEITIVR